MLSMTYCTPFYQGFHQGVYDTAEVVLGLVLAHVAVITLSDAPIAGYNLTFLAGNLLLLLLLLVFIYYLLLS